MTNTEFEENIQELKKQYLDSRLDSETKSNPEKVLAVLNEALVVLAKHFFQTMYAGIFYLSDDTHEMENRIDDQAEGIVNTFKRYCRYKMVEDFYSKEKENE